MIHNEFVSSIMTEDVISTGPDVIIAEVIELFSDHGIHHLPVVSDGELIGIISTTDIMEYGLAELSDEDKHTEYNPLDETLVSQVMKTDLITVDAGTTVFQVSELLAKNDIHSIPVVDEDNVLEGIVTSRDLIQYLLDQLILESQEEEVEL